MKNNFWGLIWSSLLGIQSLVLGFLGFVASLLAWVFAGQTPIPLVVLFVIITIAILAIATLYKALQTALEEYHRVKQNIIPKILRVQKDANNNILCLLEASDLFAPLSMISLYYTNENDFEELIGEGFVESINSEKRIQVLIDEPKITYQNILDKLTNNDLTVMQKTRVSPSVIKKFNQP